MSLRMPAVHGHIGSHGRHRRRGLIGRLHVAHTVRVHARRVLGAAALLGGAAVLCVLAALGWSPSGDSGIPGYQKPANPFLHTATSTPGAAINGQPRPSISPDLGNTTLPFLATPGPSAGSVSPIPTSPPTTTTGPSPSPSTSQSSTLSPSPSASPSPSSSPTPTPSSSPTPSSTPSPSASTPPPATQAPASTPPPATQAPAGTPTANSAASTGPAATSASSASQPEEGAS
jgi:hypothetical protein